MRLENEAGVIIEIARETRLEAQRRDIEAERGDEADPRVERVERRGEIKPGLARELAQLRRGRIGFALDAQEALDDPRLFGRNADAAPQRRLFHKTVGDLARRASADRCDSGDREKILDEGARALLVGPLQHAEHAGMIAPRAIARGIEDRRDRLALLWPRAMRRRHSGARSSAVSSPANSPASPMRTLEIEIMGDCRRIERERQDLRIRRLEVAAPETLDAGLREFAALAGGVAECRAAIGICGDASGFARGEIMPRNGNRIFRPQAIFGAREIARQVKLAAQILAGIEEDRGRLQDRWLATRIARMDEMRRDGVGGI